MGNKWGEKGNELKVQRWSQVTGCISLALNQARNHNTVGNSHSPLSRE